MISRYSSPVLYVSDDEDDNSIEFQQANSNPMSYLLTSMAYPNSTSRKRTLPDANVRVNPSIVHWSKRQRHEVYHPEHIRHDLIPHDSETINYNPNHINHESHSFHAFDWTNDTRPMPTRIYSNSMQTTQQQQQQPQSQMSILPPNNAMNVVKQQLNHLDSLSSYSQSHKSHRYHHHPSPKSMSMTATSNHIGSSPSPPPQPLPLPLPTPTSSYPRSHSQRMHAEKNVRIPYAHSIPPPSTHHSIKSVYQAPPPLIHRPPSPTSMSIPISTPEIRRQPLNGTGTLSAFYDSKCYRCNICKFKSLTSSSLLQHLFTHIFYCNHCSFYSYSQHHFHQHIFEKHCNHFNDIPDPQNLELLYLTRCPDGTFALCMDSSPPPPLTPVPPVVQPPPQLPVVLKKLAETVRSHSNDVPIKPKVTKRKPRQKKTPQDTNNAPIVLPEKRDENLVLPPSPSSSVVAKASSLTKDKPTNIYVLMKHRRCYSMFYPQCLHSLTLEYNICQEHTIRHICNTFGVTQRRKLKSKAKTGSLKFLDAVATCLKSIVNQIASKEENRNSTNLVCPLPNHILNSIFPDDDLEALTNMLKLTNKHTKSIEKNRLYRSESSIRSSNHHIFILSSSSTNKTEQSVFASLQTSITDADSPCTQTKLQKLPISCDNTHRFLKGHMNIIPRPANPVGTSSNTNDVPRRSIDSDHSDSKSIKMFKSSTDKNNNSITSAKSRQSSSPNVIVLD